MENYNNRPLNLERAVEFTGLSKAYLYSLVREKKIPHYKPLHGRIFFKQGELEDFLFRNRVAADYEVTATAETLLNKERGRRT